MSQKEKYLEEFEKYKHIQISLGNYKNKDGIEFEIVRVSNEMAEVKTKKSGVIKTRTLHWCRKYLIKYL